MEVSPLAGKPADPASLVNVPKQQVQIKDLAGERIQAVLTTAPGNGAPVWD
jgi:hypothetical protein